MKGIFVLAACHERLMDEVLIAGFVSIYKEIVYSSTAVEVKSMFIKILLNSILAEANAVELELQGGIIIAVAKNED